MAALEPPHTHHLRAAAGWLELGNPHEAQAELDRLPAALRIHPEVLQVQWEVHARRREWSDALKIAQSLTALVPDDADGWIKQSYALHELKRTPEAWNGLSAVSARFPTTSVIPYNLACYACQMGHQEEALRQFHHAMKLGGADEMKRMALEDADLRPLWEEIRKL